MKLIKSEKINNTKNINIFFILIIFKSIFNKIKFKLM